VLSAVIGGEASVDPAKSTSMLDVFSPACPRQVTTRGGDCSVTHDSLVSSIITTMDFDGVISPDPCVFYMVWIPDTTFP
jgi:hypothetical protein